MFPLRTKTNINQVHEGKAFSNRWGEEVHEVNSHLEELDGRADEHREDILGALNKAIVLLRKALTNDGGVTSFVPSPTPSWVEVSKPKFYKGVRNTKKANVEVPKSEKKELLFMQVNIRGQLVRAILDTRATKNFIKEEEAKCLVITYVGEE
ncbi:hypothetical protein V6N12_030910 [Hibiscus sabdariffa]|uniref:Gag-pol polyprotein n=1 Tax=Hibiscus sabdariffa TaxID=183260 RepID=A0ABR2E7E0_9ROSI